MRDEVQAYLDGRVEEKLFVRLHPEWYRRLSRAPWELNRLKPAADLFYGRTFGQKLDRLNQRAGLLSMLMGMAQEMTSGGSENKTEP
ncbi:YlbE-like family protein [Sporolactobacillus pectinivorans]|uniref:YlbE-like family protein n=1 Tax=Sporolactobacillus pectinivorans TaxID=1591408 RepID=UPI000C26BA8A|nr:YlbE-like family protein [Sporolactobacillus pectinivorans]